RRLPGGTGRLAGPAESHAGESSKDDAAAEAPPRGARAPGRAGRARATGRRLPARRAAQAWGNERSADVGQGPEEETVPRRGAPDTDERPRPAREPARAAQARGAVRDHHAVQVRERLA